MSTTSERATSKGDLIISVAERLGRASKFFPIADLIIAVWKEYPQQFGLAGYEATYPDSNKIASNLMGMRGLVSKGFLRRTHDGLYTMTPTGIDRAEWLGKLE